MSDGPASGLGNALGLYVHWPYCARICPYCDFNVYRPKGDDEALLAAMLADMAHWRARTGARPLASLHFGGGTPSLMTPQQLAAVIGEAERLWGFAGGVEIGLEANPKDIDGFSGMASAGINRLSLGVQSFDDQALVSLGRDHDASLARRAIDAAQRDFARVSLDMIYARAGQTADDWAAELGEALASGVGHISPYQLTIEPGTAFGKRAGRGEQLDAPPDFAADLYELTESLCADAGFEGYEISNHARSRADQSVHNRLYWEGGDWIGIGPGAHGRIGCASAGGRAATEAARRPADYIRRVEETGTGIAGEEALAVADEIVERILMGMRLADGLDIDHLHATTGSGIDPDGLARMMRQGMVEQAGSRIRLTAAGRLLADGVSGELVP